MADSERDTCQTFGTVKMGLDILAGYRKLWYAVVRKDMEVSFMLKFIVMLPFRILFLPVLLFLKLTFWICTGLLCMAEWIFGLASGILLVLSLLGMIWVSVPQGIVMLGIAFLISPYGIPMLAVKLVTLAEVMAQFIWKTVY